MSEERVKEEIEAKEAQLKHLESVLKEEQKRFEHLPDIVNLEEQNKVNERLKNEAYKKREKLTKQVYSIITIDGYNPSYNTSQYTVGIQTNIKPEVLKAIKTVVGGVSKLKHSQVEELTQKLIDLEEKKHYPELEQAQKEIDLYESRNRRYYESRGLLEKEKTQLEQLRHEIYMLKIQLQSLYKSIDEKTKQKKERAETQDVILSSPEIIEKIYIVAKENIKATEDYYKEKAKRM